MIDVSSSHLSAPTYVRMRERLRSDIVSGVWKLGQHVTLAELTRHYGVGANPLREALQQLQGEGVVEMRMHRGAMVRNVDAGFVRNVYDVRGAIEAMLAAAAAEQRSPADLARIEACVDAYEQAVAEGEHGAIVSANRALHRTINQIAQNPLALEIFDGRSSLIDALRLSLGSRPGRLEEIVAEHRAILAAIASRDADLAAQAAQNHTRRARDHMLDNLEEKAAG